MAWWRRFKNARTPPPDDPSLPATIEIIPGSLAATIFAHDLPTADGALTCWTFVSDGLIAQVQKEMVFTVARRANEHPQVFAAEVLKLLRTVHSLASQGRRVDVGDFTEFTSGGGPAGVRVSVTLDRSGSPVSIFLCPH